MVDSLLDLKSFTDCLYFLSGQCQREHQCLFRHCQAAIIQTKTCEKWPQICRNLTCSYRHPAIIPKASAVNKPTLREPHSQPAKASADMQSRHLISFFWDIENVPIPKGSKPFDIIQRIREKLVVETGLREEAFSCYCNVMTIPQDKQISLSHANVRMIHVPDRKPGAVDRHIMLDLDRFERSHQPPATIVLISGDIDYVGKLSDLRHHAGYHVIVIHNKPAKQELKATVNAHYSWETFTQETSSPMNPSNDEIVHIPSLMLGVEEPVEKRHSRGSRSRSRRQRDPSAEKRFASCHRSQASPMPFLCPLCTEKFETIRALQQHQKDKDHLFSCSFCDQSFFTQAGQKQHQIEKAHDSLQYRCQQCQRRFAKIESLKQHQQATGHQRELVELVESLTMADASPWHSFDRAKVPK